MLICAVELQGTVLVHQTVPPPKNPVQPILSTNVPALFLSGIFWRFLGNVCSVESVGSVGSVGLVGSIEDALDQQ